MTRLRTLWTIIPLPWLRLSRYALVVYTTSITITAVIVSRSTEDSHDLNPYDTEESQTAGEVQLWVLRCFGMREG